MTLQIMLNAFWAVTLCLTTVAAGLLALRGHSAVLRRTVCRLGLTGTLVVLPASVWLSWANPHEGLWLHFSAPALRGRATPTLAASQVVCGRNPSPAAYAAGQPAPAHEAAQPSESARGEGVAQTPAATHDENLALPHESALASIPAAVAAAPVSDESWRSRWALAAALGVTLAMQLHLAWRLERLRLWRRRWLRAPEAWVSVTRRIAGRLGLRGSFEVLATRSISQPAASGIFRPAIVLPSEIHRPRDMGIRAVLAHELGHLKGRDPLWNMISFLVLTMTWWCPLAWWIRSRTRVESELAADDQAIACGTSAVGLARTLATFAQGDSPAAPIALAGMASDLPRRIKMALNEQIPHCPTISDGWLVTLACCFVATVAAVVSVPLTGIAQSAAGAPDSALTPDSIPAAEETFFAPLLDAVDKGDTETAARVKAVLSEVRFLAQLKFYESTLSQPLRDKLARLQKESPKLVHDLLSPIAATRIETLKSLSDPDGLAEPLLVINLRFGSSAVAGTAAAACVPDAYRSDDLLNALSAILVDGVLDPSYTFTQYTWQAMGAGMDHRGDSINALKAKHDPKSAAVMLAVLLRAIEQGRDYHLTIAMIDAIAAMNDKRAVGLLVDKLSQLPATMPATASATMYDPRAAILYAIIKAAHVDFSEYGVAENVQKWKIAFTSDDSRTADLDRFKQWWASHQNDDGYRGLKPVQLPDLAKFAASMQLSVTDAQSAAKAGIKSSLPPDVQARIKKDIDTFQADSPRDRKAAQNDLVAVQKQFVDSIFEHVKNPAEGGSAASLLSSVASEAFLQEVLATTSREQRGKWAAFRQANAQLARELLSCDQATVIRGIKKLAALKDEQGLAEPALLLCLRHPSQDPALQAAAAEAACSGRYKSDAVVDALGEHIAKGLPVPITWLTDNLGGASYKKAAVLSSGAMTAAFATKAMAKIGSPKATGILVDVLRRQTGAYCSVAMNALIASGDKRAIPTLMENLGDTKVMGKAGDAGNWTFTVAGSDRFLYAIVKLTGQDAAVYKIMFRKLGDSPFGEIGEYGFANGADRDAAIKELKEWWGKNKDTDAYKGVQPLKPTATSKPL